MFVLCIFLEVSQYRAVACNLNNENKPMSSLEDLNQDSSKGIELIVNNCSVTGVF